MTAPGLFAQNISTCSLSRGVSQGEQMVCFPSHSVVSRPSLPPNSTPPNVLILAPSFYNITPRLPLSKLEMIQDTVLKKLLTASQLAKAAECSKRSVINISNNLRWLGNIRAPPTYIGRRRSVSPLMLEALCDHLLEKPGLYLDEMAIFLFS